jgi:hypothetical protein
VEVSDWNRDEENCRCFEEGFSGKLGEISATDGPLTYTRGTPCCAQRTCESPTREKWERRCGMRGEQEVRGSDKRKDEERISTRTGQSKTVKSSPCTHFLTLLSLSAGGAGGARETARFLGVGAAVTSLAIRVACALLNPAAGVFRGIIRRRGVSAGVAAGAGTGVRAGVLGAA